MTPAAVGDRFDVVIVCAKSGTVEAVIGSNLRERQADRRLMAGLMQCGPGYFVDTVPGGTAVKGGKVKS